MNRRSFLISAAGAGAALTAPPIIEASPAFGEDSGLMSNRGANEDRQLVQAKTVIGNLHAFMPGGIAFIKNDDFGIVLDVGWDQDGRPGSCAPDFSMNSIRFDREDAHLQFDWSRVSDDAAVARISSDKSIMLTLAIPSRPWHAFNNMITTTKHGLEAVCIAPNAATTTWVLNISPVPLPAQVGAVPGLTFNVPVSPHAPIRLAAGFGGVPDLGGVDNFLDAAIVRYEATRARSVGGWGDFAGAIADNLNNSRLYSSLNKRVATVIGRGDWIVTNPDYPPYFAWDTSFNALLASLEDPEHAKATMRALLAYQLPNGMVAQIANWNHDPLPYLNIRNSNPPVTSLCAWKIYQRWPDRNFLGEVYSALLRWHEWWPQYCDGNNNGLLEWGAAGSFQDARLACGWDDTPAFDGAEMIGTQMNADAVDLNSLWSMDAEFLSKMAEELGLKSDAAGLRQQHSHINNLMNELLWNEELGVYCSRLWSKNGSPGTFLTRLTPMNFYPLICGAPDEQKARRVLETLTSPAKFWGRWPVPTLAYDDPEWPRQDYWKGHTWAPVNYLIWQGIHRYGTQAQQCELAQRSVELFMRNWREKGSCNEAYKSSDGSGDRYPHYTWGALLCQIGIEFFYEAAAAGQPMPSRDAALFHDIDLRNMPSGGRLYRIRSSAGRWNIELE
jgi:hypothetical protein